MERQPVLLLFAWITVWLFASGCQTPNRIHNVVNDVSSSPGEVTVSQTPTGDQVLREQPTIDYDRVLSDAIQERWHHLIQVNPEASTFIGGKVVMRFKLHSDGQVSDVYVKETTVPKKLVLLCEKAIRDPAPFGAWPREMPIKVGAHERNMTFTFNYSACAGAVSDADRKEPMHSAYDRLLLEVVREKWSDLLSRTNTAPTVGKVIIRMKLHPEGNISDVTTLEATVPPPHPLLCETAIRSRAPFQEWPPDMRAAEGANERIMTLVFQYSELPQRTIQEVLILRKKGIATPPVRTLHLQ